MKTTTRILIALLLVVSLLCALCVFVSAEGEDETTPEPETAVSEENVASEAVEEKGGFADALWDFVASNAATIFSGVSLACIGVLFFLWKKGLLPIVERALTKIFQSVTEASDSLEGKSDEMSQTMLGFLKRLEPYLPMLKDLTESLQSVKAEKDAQLIINRETVNLLCLMVETARFPDSVKEQARLYKTECDKAMMENEGSGDSE